MVNPGGTGTPARDISASPAPLPPSVSFILPSPSAVPFPKAYTYCFMKKAPCKWSVASGWRSVCESLRNDLRKISDRRELSQQIVQQGEPVAPNVRVRGVDQNLVKKEIDGGAQRGDRLQRSRVFALSRDVPHAPKFTVELLLRSRLEKTLTAGVAALEFCLTQDVLDSLETCGKGLEILSGTYGLQRGKASFYIDQVVPTGGKDRIHLVVPEAANLAEVIFDAIQEEFTKLCIAAGEFAQRELEFTFHQDADHALRGASQREGVFRSGRDQADRKTTAQRVELVRQRQQPPGRGGRDRVFHAGRLVLVVDGAPDLLGL